MGVCIVPKALSKLPPGIGDRLKALRTQLSMNQGEFANTVGVTQATLSRMESGLGPISAEVIYGILKKWPYTDIHNLLFGVPCPQKSSAIEVASKITPVIRPIQQPSNGISSEVAADDYFAVPLVEGQVAAGPGGYLWEQVQSLVWVYRPELGGHKKLIAVRVAGDSMFPTVPDGAIVIIDLDCRDPRGDRRNIWAIRTDQEGALAVKRLQKNKNRPDYLILSDNFTMYPPEVAWTNEPSELVVGQVVWMWRSLA